MKNSRIITFYSYKGGVGRSFALANISVLLARWGCRVLCIDWDLEAPGLHYYFSVEPNSGLLEILQGVRTNQRRDWHQSLTHIDVEGTEGRLSLLAAGCQDKNYVSSVQSLDWDTLYSENDIGGYLESIRGTWLDEYDLVLVDSRTGVTDAGAICISQLADVLVVFLTANEQGLSGVLDVVGRAEKARELLPFERRRLLTLPVLSRFDSDKEYDLAELWKKKLIERFSFFYNTWRNEKSSVNRLADLCTLPYISKWSFGEQLAVLSETRRSEYFISYFLENIASLLAMRFKRTELFTESPDAYVELAKRETLRLSQSRQNDSKSGFLYDFFISYPSQKGQLAKEVDEVLSTDGSRLWSDHIDDKEAVPEIAGSGSLNDKLARSKNFVLMIGDEFSSRQEDEAFSFLKQSIEERSSRLIIPILVGSMDPKKLPSVLATTRYIDARSKDPNFIALQIKKAQSSSNETMLTGNKKTAKDTQQHVNRSLKKKDNSSLNKATLKRNVPPPKG